MGLNYIAPILGSSEGGALLQRTPITSALLTGGTETAGSGGNTIDSASADGTDLITLTSPAALTATATAGYRQAESIRIALTDLYGSYDPTAHDVIVTLTDIAFTGDDIAVGAGLITTGTVSSSHAAILAVTSGRVGYLLTTNLSTTSYPGATEAYGRIETSDDRTTLRTHERTSGDWAPIHAVWSNAGYDEANAEFALYLSARGNVTQVSTVQCRCYVDFVRTAQEPA